MRPILCLFSAAGLLVSACAQMSAPSPVGTNQISDAAMAAPSISISAPPAAPAQPSRAPASYNSVYTSKPVLALTFDDGPHPELTPRLLDILRAEGCNQAQGNLIGRPMLPDQISDLINAPASDGRNALSQAA
jgi:hypothetical protein